MRPPGLDVPSSGRDRGTGLITIEARLLDHPGWVVSADIDDTGHMAEIVAVAVRREDHPLSSVSSKGLVPSGSITAGILRSVPLTDLLTAANDHLRFHSPSKRLPDPHKLRERSPKYYATWAALYVDAVRRNPRRAISDLADAHGVDRTVMRDLINRCRAKGYLTRGQPGRAGGELTPSTIDVLKGSKR